MSGLGTLGGLLLGFVAANAPGRMQNDARSPRHTGSASRTAELLGRCAQADAKAFRTLYELNSAKLFAIALRITRSPALASDAVHDAMLQVWRNAARYEPDRGNADGWLISLVRYRALDIARRQGREATGVELPERLDEAPDALTRMVSDAEGAALRTCLETVEEPRRQLVLLAFIHGMTQTEIAGHVGQPLGTVKSSIRRALLVLRACLDRTLGQHSPGVGS